MTVESPVEIFLDAKVERVDLGATQMAFRRFGSGPVLLFVHGFPLSGFTWRKIIPEISKHQTCIVPDLPGFGETVWTEKTDFSFPGQGHTLKALADALDLDRYSVIGQDTGGTFARYMVLSDVARVDKLLIINSEMPGHRPPFIPMYQAMMRLPGAGSAFKLLLKSQTFLRSAMGFGGCFNDLSLIGGEFAEHVLNPVLSSGAKMEGLKRYLTGAKWGPVDALREEHAHLTMPVRLIWGLDDPTFPIGLAREMLAQFPDAELVEIPGARLLAHEEKPEQVAAAVLEFLN